MNFRIFQVYIDDSALTVKYFNEIIEVQSFISTERPFPNEIIMRIYQRRYKFRTKCSENFIIE